MKNPAALAGLLVVSIAAGVWLFLPAPSDQPAASCDSGSACTTGDAPPPEASEPNEAPQQPGETSLAPDPPAETPAPAPAPVPAAQVDAVELRRQADELLAAGRYPEAIDALKAATKADPSARNHGDLGDLLQRVLRQDEALINLRKAANLDPGNPDRWIALANAYYRDVDPGKAWAAEKRAKQADPSLVLGFDASGRRVRKSDATGDSPSGNP